MTPCEGFEGVTPVQLEGGNPGDRAWSCWRRDGRTVEMDYHIERQPVVILPLPGATP